MNQPFEHKKSLGQHFLNSDYVPKQMCDAAQLQPGDTVLEIGPGTGALTRELIARGVTVVAIEADQRAIGSLQDTFAEAIAGGQLQVHHMDARHIDFEALQLQNHAFKVVANIPYYLSGLLFRQCLESLIQPSSLVFLVQKEVAERIARSDKESILSLSVKVFGEPSYIHTVKRGHFTPPPAVDSAIVAVHNISRENLILQGILAEHYFTLLHLGFGQKRKQLQGNLSQQFPREAVAAALRAAAIPDTARAEDLSVEQFLILTRLLYAS